MNKRTHVMHTLKKITFMATFVLSWLISCPVFAFDIVGYWYDPKEGLVCKITPDKIVGIKYNVIESNDKNIVITHDDGNIKLIFENIADDEIRMINTASGYTVDYFLVTRDLNIPLRDVRVMGAKMARALKAKKDQAGK